MMSRSLIGLLGLLLATPALGADHELSLELGTLHIGDPAFDVFSHGDALPSKGLRAGVAVHERLAVVAGWHHTARGAELHSSEGKLLARSSFRGEAFTLGVKPDLAIGPYFRPYLLVQGMLLAGQVRFDDDPNESDSPGQIQESAVAPGLLTMGGIELRAPMGGAPLTIAFHLEGGYGRTAPLAFDDVGDLQPGGLALRGGVGVRF
jgi:hypothetical protein